MDRYHLQLHQDRLVRLCARWEKSLPDFGQGKDSLPPWGPTASQLRSCRADAHRPARGEHRHYGDDVRSEEEHGWSEEEDDEESGGEEEDFGLLDAAERADVYRDE